MRAIAFGRHAAEFVRLVMDPLDGPLVVVGGSAPFLVRIVGARTLLDLTVEGVEGVDFTEDRCVWSPEFVPAALRGQRFVLFVPVSRFYPVDLFWIGWGTPPGYHGVGAFEWDGAACALRAVSVPTARGRLADDTFERQRQRATRGILLE